MGSFYSDGELKGWYEGGGREVECDQEPVVGVGNILDVWSYSGKQTVDVNLE